MTFYSEDNETVLTTINNHLLSITFLTFILVSILNLVVMSSCDGRNHGEHLGTVARPSLETLSMTFFYIVNSSNCIVNEFMQESVPKSLSHS